jgi:hypothetical protein
MFDSHLYVGIGYCFSLSKVLRHYCSVVWRIVIGVGGMAQAESFGGGGTSPGIGLYSSYCIMILIGAISILYKSIEIVLGKSYLPSLSE